MTVSNEEFEQRSGLEVPSTPDSVEKARQIIREGLRLMSPDQRQEFLDKQPADRKLMAELLLMPQDLTNLEELERWLAE